jgi:hypothetical protein
MGQHLHHLQHVLAYHVCNGSLTHSSAAFLAQLGLSMHFVDANSLSCVAAAGGLASKEANAVRERVTGLKRTLRSTITKYNTLRSHGSVDRPADVTEEQVVSGEFPWIFRGLDDGSPGEGW